MKWCGRGGWAHRNNHEIAACEVSSVFSVSSVVQAFLPPPLIAKHSPLQNTISQIRLEPDSNDWARAERSLCATTQRSRKKIAALQISSSLNWRAIRVADKAVQFVSQPFTSDIDHTGVAF